MSRALLFFISLLLLFCGAGILWVASNQSRATAGGSSVEKDEDYLPTEKELTEFEFVDQLAQPFGSADLQGKVWLGSFFFADCPSICVQQNTEISKIHQRFLKDDVVIVNITVAPDKDPPHKLWTYANRFDADHDRWKFLTGKDIDYVRQVGLDIFTLAAADETHTSSVAVFDREGNRHGDYNVNEPIEFAKLVSKVEELLADDPVGAETSDATGDSPAGVSDDMTALTPESQET